MLNITKLCVFVFFIVALAQCQRADSSISWVTCPTARSSSDAKDVIFSYDPFNTLPHNSILKFEHTKQKRSEQQTVTTRCAFINVPMIWTNSSDTRTIKLGVKKVSVSDVSKRKGAIILMEGGPGASSTNSFSGIANSLRIMLNDQYDIIMVDHRGISLSTNLVCSIQAATTPAQISTCYQQVKNTWGLSGLQSFSTSNAARDVIHLASLLKSEASPSTLKIAMYGVSYGTHWLNRILQLDPTSADLAIADSVTTPPFSFDDWDLQFDEVFKLFVSACSADSFCNSTFSSLKQGSVLQVVQNMFTKLKSEKTLCGSPFNLANLRQLIAGFMQAHINRKLVLPFVFRAMRCNATLYDDVYTTVIYKILVASFGTQVDSSISRSTTQTQGVTFSQQLQRNIVCGELWNYNGRTKQQMAEHLENSLAAFNYSSYLFEACAAQNNESYIEPLRTQMAPNFARPMLTMMSTLDPQTVYSKSGPWRDFYNSRNSKHVFLTMPNQVHASMLTGIYYSNSAKSCGMEIMAQFVLQESAANLNTSCFSEMIDGTTVNFKMDNFVPLSNALVQLGVPDLWGMVAKPLANGAYQVATAPSVCLIILSVIISLFFL